VSDALQQLYQDMILEHNRAPKNFRVMADADGKADGYNPMCGDQLTVWLKMDGNRIADVSFDGKGCAISTASASLMTGAVKGKTRAEAEALFQGFHDLVTGKADAKAAKALGKLAVFSGVSEFPSRVKCASLPWHALKVALDARDAVSTE
jgi:nitrogen fixation protein NifU and related proteins